MGRGEAWSILSLEWRFVYLGRQKGGVLDQKNTSYTRVLPGAVQLRFAKLWNSSAWGRNYKMRPQAFFFCVMEDTSPLSVYIGRQNATHMIKWTRLPPPLLYCYCKLSKKWTVGRTESEATYIVHTSRPSKTCSQRGVIKSLLSTDCWSAQYKSS